MISENNFPFLKEFDRLEPLQLAWLSGYCWAKAKGENAAGDAIAPALSQTTAAIPLTVSVLSASQTGNAKAVADKLAERLKAEGLAVKRAALKDYKAKTLAEEQLVLLVTSTQGEGEPPEEGLVLFKWLNGKKAPNLSGLSFAVLGLGDSSYPNFCQAGKDFDKRLAELGGTRLLARADADLEFEAAAEKWIEEVVAVVKSKAAASHAAPQTVQAAAAVSDICAYNRENPFPAPLLTNQKITGRTSDKDVRHLELDLSGSGLVYQPGDALGVWCENDPALVAEIAACLGIDLHAEIQLNEKKFNFETALLTQLELTQNTPAFVKAYAELAGNADLNALAADSEKLNAYVQNTPIVDVLHDFPATLSAQQFVDLLRPLSPRLYSISSSPAEVGEEVHLSVGVVRFEHEGSARAGAASSYLADRVAEDCPVRVFVERNDLFRLPQDNSKSVIMIGSGTGIAPFRAFVQQRAAEEAPGKNWLIFGNPHFASDFLYQTEWQQFVKEGYLHKYDFAWSRDQAEKIYVQDKIREKATALWQWLQDGAFIYVCGDAGRMAKDVEAALIDVIAQQGGLDHDDAEDYLNDLRENGRYQRDVY